MTDESERLEAEPSSETREDRYFTHGCGAETLKRDAGTPAEFLTETLPAHAAALHLDKVRRLLNEKLQEMTAVAAEVSALSAQEAELLRKVSGAALSGTLPDWATPLVGRDTPKPQKPSERRTGRTAHQRMSERW